ncbi:MAG: hypothetical protein QGH73_04490, partial [Rhodospirillales bacterium]|nr:hypothetical protein [Rhodospirillales bacterium]
ICFLYYLSKSKIAIYHLLLALELGGCRQDYSPFQKRERLEGTAMGDFDQYTRGGLWVETASRVIIGLGAKRRDS